MSSNCLEPINSWLAWCQFDRFRTRAPSKPWYSEVAPSMDHIAKPSSLSAQPELRCAAQRQERWKFPQRAILHLGGDSHKLASTCPARQFRMIQLRSCSSAEDTS